MAETSLLDGIAVVDCAAVLGSAGEPRADRSSWPRSSPSRWRALGPDRGRVCVVVPDTTRSCPLPELLKAVHRALAGRVEALTVLVALGTHPAIPSRRGWPQWLGTADLPGCRDPPARVVGSGDVRRGRGGPGGRAGRAVGRGRLAEDVHVRVNRAVVEHDALLVVGPVFPHEVVGFSGGDKYFFPGYLRSLR